jgi:gamma-glutamyl:cysteine ligase YbdK (ATP-grasp superfamily)
MVAVSCSQETNGGARKEVNSGQAPLFISEGNDSAFLKDAEAMVKELREKIGRVEDDLRKSAEMASAQKEFDEAKKRLESMEKDLEKLRVEGKDASRELINDLRQKEEELEIFLNRAASEAGGN